MDNVEIVPCPLRTSDITLKSPFSKQVLSMCWDQDAKKWAPVWIKIIKYLLTKPILIGHRLDNMADEKGEKMTFMLPVINENSLSDPNWRNEFVKAVKLFNSACDLMMEPSIESPAGTPSSTRSNGNLWRRSRCDEELMKLVCETIFSPSLSPKNIGEIAYILSVLPEVLYHQDVVSILGAHSDFSALYLAGIVDVKRINGIVVDPIPAVETVAQFEKLMRYFGKTESPFELHGPGYEIYNDDYIKESTVFFVNNTTIDKDTENELADFVATKVKKTSRIICTKAISSFANHGVKMDKKEKRHMNKTVLHIYTFRRASSVPRLTTEAFTPKRSPSDTEFEPRVKLPRIKISNSPAHDQNITTSKAKSEEDICKYLDDSITSLLSAKKTMIEEHESKLRLQDLLTESENTIKNLEEQIQNTGESFEKKKIALESDLVMIKSELKKQEEDLKLVNSLLKEKKKTSDDEKTTIIHKQKEELDKLKLRLEALESTREAKPQISSDTEQLLRNKTNELAIVMLDRDRLEKQLNQITEDYRELMKKVLNSNNSAPLPPNKEPKEEPP